MQSNGLPTPVFNFLKRVVLFQVATITSDNMAIQASGLPSTNGMTRKELEKTAEIINDQLKAIWERNRIVGKAREFMRNAAVAGDGCMYVYWDNSVKNGQPSPGEIAVEVIANTRVHFGNPNDREVQTQPYIIIARRMLPEDVEWMAEQNGKKISDMEPDSDSFQNEYDGYANDKVTLLTMFWRDRETGKIWSCECTEKDMVRDPYDTDLELYPLVWLNWDYKTDCYHGQAMITGLIPNQTFINKIFAMAGVSMMTTAFPKIVYDKNKIKNWDGTVGAAVGVTGDVTSVATVLNPAAMNPQIAQFMELCIDKTQSFLGASDVAMGDSRPDNTSAIIALQRAANTPMELTKQSLYQCMEDMGQIFLDMMRCHYGKRYVTTSMDLAEMGAQPLGMSLPKQEFTAMYDFATLAEIQFSINYEVGASSYWSEIASQQTLDNLLMQNQITLAQYLERVPQGYITKKQELLDEVRGASAAAQPTASAGGAGGMPPASLDDIPVEGGPGNAQLQRALNQTGVD